MFKVQFETDNAIFADDPEEEIARILKLVAKEVLRGDTQHNIRDINGNLVGGWSFEV